MSVIPPLIILPTRLFPLLLGLLVAVRLLSGGILTRGLLSDPQTGRFSALRIQMLIATLLAALSYACAIGRSALLELPPVDPRLLALIAGSNSLPLGYRLFARFSKQPKPTKQG